MTGQIPPKPAPPPKYRQRVILQDGGWAFKTALDEALRDGGTIEQIAVNSASNYWMGIVGRAH